MVTFADAGKIVAQTYSNSINTRSHKRIPLKVYLFVRSLQNHISYSKMVQTVDVSHKGLLVSCDVALKQGMQIEVTSASRKVKVVAEVKHTSYDSESKKWLTGLAITEKQNGWLVQEPTLTAALFTNY